MDATIAPVMEQADIADLKSAAERRVGSTPTRGIDNLIAYIGEKMSIVIDNYDNTRSLPLGHIDRKKAEIALNKEYEASNLKELAWFRSLRKKW